jgi:hypothetical protein
MQLDSCYEEFSGSDIFCREFFLVAFVLFVFSGIASAGTYTDSAHGSSSIGVRRKSTAEYARGNCAHCHEQHASLEGSEPTPAGGGPSVFALLGDNFDESQTGSSYVQSDDVCFYCHANTTSLQSGGIDNRDYSETFGGYLGGQRALSRCSNRHPTTICTTSGPFQGWSFPCFHRGLQPLHGLP